MADSGPEHTISAIRRKLIAASAPAEPADARSESIDFDQYENGDNGASAGFEQLLKPHGGNGHDDMDALLHRYQVEKGLGHVEPPAPRQQQPVHQDTRPLNGHGPAPSGVRPSAAPKGLPPLTKGGKSEVQRLEA